MTTIYVEDMSEVKKKITFEVPEETVREAIDAEYINLRKNLQIKGFRRGKVPLDIIRGYYKKEVLAEAGRKLIEETFESSLEKHGIKPIKILNVTQDDIVEGKSFKYIAEMEVQPRVKVKGYTGLELTKNLYPVSEAQVQKRIEALRRRCAHLSPFRESRGIATKDWVYLDIDAQLDGEPVKELTVRDYPMDMGRDFYLPGFDNLIKGMHVNETREITLTLPEDFRLKDLAGKTVALTVTLKDAKEYVLPELDDEFAKELGDYETLDELLVDIRASLQKQAESRSRTELESAILDVLVAENPLEIPEGLIENQIDTIINEMKGYLATKGMNIDQMPPPTMDMRETLRPQATRAVHAGLIIKAISEQENLDVSEEELTEKLQAKANELGMSLDYLKDMAGDTIFTELRTRIIEEKVFRFIQEHSHIVEVEKTAEYSAESAQEHGEKRGDANGSIEPS